MRSRSGGCPAFAMGPRKPRKRRQHTLLHLAVAKCNKIWAPRGPLCRLELRLRANHPEMSSDLLVAPRRNTY
eukprot:5267626-Pyramimonas_sp.AAC.1